MSATIKSMEYIFADTLNADQLMVDDLIDVEGDIVQVINIISLSDGYAITYRNDFGEEEIVEVGDYSTFKLYVLIDE
jgi:hypothetical protein